MVIQRRDALLRERIARDAAAHRGGHGVELPEAVRDVDVRILVLREQQARLGEAELLACQELGETV